MRKSLATDLRPEVVSRRVAFGAMMAIVIAVSLYILLAHSTLREVEVNGPIYGAVVQNKDLIADILPPPIYLIESYTLTLEMLQTRDKPRLAAIEGQLGELRTVFSERHRFWTERYRKSPPIRAALDKAFESGMAFYDMVGTQFVPLIEKGDYAGAGRLAEGAMRARYDRHRADIDGLVALARERDDGEQRRAAGLIARRTWIQYAWEAVTILLVVVPTVWFFGAKKRLRRTERHLQAIFDNGSDLIFGVAVEEGGVFRYMMINPAGARLGGIDPKRFVGSTPAEYFPAEKAAVLEANYRRCLEKGETISFERATDTASGLLIFETTLVPVRDEAGRISQIMGVSRNVTAQKSTLEAMQRLNGELEQRVAERTRDKEEAYRELEMFSYSVSHDLRSPLRGINGFCNALIEDYGPTLEPEARAYLERIHVASRRMAQIIDDLLQLSRVSRGTLAFQEVDLSFLACRVADDLRAAAPERAVTVSIAPGLAARCDLRLMQNVLENLLGNAWKYTLRQPAARIEFDAVAVDGRRAFRVRDNGAGFDMRFVGKLFQNFQRLHDRTEFEGTGVGLAIVARIVRRHGGRVWAEGAVGQGASFYFALDETPQPERPALPA